MEEKFKEHLEKYVADIESAIHANYDKNYPNLKKPSIKYTVGKKYIKIIKFDNQKQIYCFIDMNGNIYKAATWYAPAKGIRGSIYNDVKPLLYIEFYK